MNLPIPDQLKNQLIRGGSRIDVLNAHGALTAAGYSFAGYHGTNERSAAAIQLEGFDRSFAGSSAGLARGVGLYVARTFQMAEDFSDTATQAGDPDPFTGEVPRRPARAGNPVVLRIYVRGFESMQNGVDYEWGGMGTGLFTPTQDVISQQEIVFRPRAYQQLVAFSNTREIEEWLLGAHPQSSPALQANEAPH
jgi:hypothetical protein